VKLGKPGYEVVGGGETAYNFYLFEGDMPNPPKLALQVLDIEPEEWAPEALEPYKEVIGDPVAWAKKCVEEFGADLVCLWLAGTDPNGKNLSAEHAAEVARKVAESVTVPLIVWGVSSDNKNTEVLRAVAEACAGFNVVLGPVTEGSQVHSDPHFLAVSLWEWYTGQLKHLITGFPTIRPLASNSVPSNILSKGASLLHLSSFVFPVRYAGQPFRTSSGHCLASQHPIRDSPGQCDERSPSAPGVFSLTPNCTCRRRPSSGWPP
jgi:hypothetical protein